MSLKDEIAQNPQAHKRRGPVWKGPEVDGVTFSLLSRFLSCRERFRVYALEGLTVRDGFNHRLEYGQMWHHCEEAIAGAEEFIADQSPVKKILADNLWLARLKDYANALCKRYPNQQDQVEHWYRVCKLQFPLYVDYWKQHPDTVRRKPLLQEEKFSVAYKLPSGRMVRLRGKWDSVDLVSKDEYLGQRVDGIRLQENKTKGDIDEARMHRQLKFDMQTGLYLTALTAYQQEPKQYRLGGVGIPRAMPILGVRYNVVRRPLAGGKGTIRQHQPSKSNPQGESKDAFYGRVAQYIKDEPSHFFMRWKVDVTPSDVEEFRKCTLDPILEQLCTWWDALSVFTDSRDIWDAPFNNIHWRHPYGLYNPMDQGLEGDVDEYLNTGSKLGLREIDNLFPELEE